MKIVLASQSPYRKALLSNFGLSFEAVKPQVDEEELKRQGPRDPLELTRFLALQKAVSVQKQFPSAVILGSDQLAELEGERLDKPGSHEKAKAQLTRMQGKTHRLITSLCVVSPQTTHTFTDVTRIRLRELTESEIESYLHLDQPYDCAGSYKIEKAGMALVEKLETEDPSAIQGLPMISLTVAFKKLGIPWNELWRKP